MNSITCFPLALIIGLSDGTTGDGKSFNLGVDLANFLTAADKGLGEQLDLDFSAKSDEYNTLSTVVP